MRREGQGGVEKEEKGKRMKEIRGG